MYRSSMQTPPRDLAVPGSHSAQPSNRGRNHPPSLHDLIQPLQIDDRERRALRARARFTWSITETNTDSLECRQAARIFSPVSWALPV